jgi:hypothetical protein
MRLPGNRVGVCLLIPFDVYIPRNVFSKQINRGSQPINLYQFQTTSILNMFTTVKKTVFRLDKIKLILLNRLMETMYFLS